MIIGGQNYVGGNGDIVLNGIVSGGTNNVYSLYKQGTGTWTFANPNNTFDGLYYQIGGVTEVTKLANAGEASSLGQVSSSQNTFVFGFTGSGGGTLRYIGATASTSDRAFSLRGATAAASNTIEAVGTSPAATLTLAGANSTFSGNIVIAGGAGSNSIVRAGNVSAFGTGTVTILGGGGNTGSTFDLNGNSLDNSLVIGLGNSGVGDAGALQNSNAAVPAVLNGAVSLGGEIYVGGPGDIRFNGLVSGTINPANP